MTIFIKPDIPGSKITLEGVQTVRPPLSVASTVAIPITHDWGPLGGDPVATGGGPVLCQSFGDFELAFGNSPSPGRDAVLGAFVGPGVAGEPGAGAVLVYRMANASAKSTIQINNTTPAAALRLDAVYAGTRGDRITAIVENDPNDATRDRLRILFDGATVERYSYAEADIAALVAAVNARSRYVKATSLITGVKLDQADDGALTGGADGATLTSAQWIAALAALEFEEFSILAPYDLEDPAIQASVVAWLQTQAEEMRPVITVLGGPSSETTLDLAITRTNGIRDLHAVSLGAGIFHDDFLDKDVNTAQLAPRVAGALAGRGEEKALTRTPFAGLSIVGAPAIATDELRDAADFGVTALRRVSSENAALAVSWGVTTFTDDADPRFDIFREPRLVHMLDLFIRRNTKWGDENIIGGTTVREETRKAVEDHGKAEIADLLRRGLILPGNESQGTQPFFHAIETDNDMIPYEFGFKPTPTTNFLVGVGFVR